MLSTGPLPCRTECIRPEDLPEQFYNLQAGACMIDAQSGVCEDSLDAYELAAIRNALTKCGGNRKKTAHMLVIGEATLYRKLKKYKLSTL